jgi:hypothetical protein
MYDLKLIGIPAIFLSLPSLSLNLLNRITVLLVVYLSLAAFLGVVDRLESVGQAVHEHHLEACRSKTKNEQMWEIGLAKIKITQ